MERKKKNSSARQPLPQSPTENAEPSSPTIEPPIARRHAARGQKPPKPRPDFPLTAGANGQWQKMIRGVKRNFGPWNDPAGAEERFNAEKDDWYAGRNPRLNAPRRGPATTLVEVCDRWLIVRREKTKALGKARISMRSYFDSERTTVKLREIMGDESDPMQWWPDDFARIRQKLGKGIGPAALYNYVMNVRAMFNWAASNGVLPGPVKWGDQFPNVSQSEKREARFENQQANGERRFELDTARAILASVDNSAKTHLDPYLAGEEDNPNHHKMVGSQVEKNMAISAALIRATTYLAANTGAYLSDIAFLADIDIDLNAGTIATKRVKTSILWQATLWPETVGAIRQYLKVRPALLPEWLAWWRTERAANQTSEAGREAAMKLEPIFVSSDGFPLVHQKVKTDESGNPTKTSNMNAIANTYKALLEDLGAEAKGLSFGAWRHTFRSIAADALGVNVVDVKRLDAINRIMAHRVPGVADTYVKMEPEQLRPITDAVRAQLLLDGNTVTGKLAGSGVRMRLVS